ncbi:MAG: murein DD-endopeptidase MepM/ murein hydrolase activator NlpD [Cyclobacteriaceae bacterium]|jgi:murein DD-endopeptidase MepM/ murein hydrolase activator NlpD
MEAPVDSTIYVIEPTLKYGINVDSLEEIRGKIKWNQNLSEILSAYNISNETIYAVAKASKGIFDVRKLKAGYPFSVFVNKDSIKTASHFVFEPDKTEYVVFNLQDSVYVTRNKRPITILEETIVAEINSSLYETVLEQGASPMLVNRLVDVFAWQVDFFRIQKGDIFKVIYEVEKVDGEVVSIGKIKAAYFKHFGHEYYAINYLNGGIESFFDEQGNSLRKTFLRAPLNYSRISSRYNPKRYHPVLKRYKAHLGTDYAAPTGTPIRTVGDGVVLEATYNSGNGKYVKIKHNSNYTTQYLHMSKIAAGIKPGVKVKQGQTIGLVGSTGLANGPHLCFRFWKNGVQVDALKVDLPPSEPISLEKRSDFLHLKNVMITRLQKISIEVDTVAYEQIVSKTVVATDKNF